MWRERVTIASHVPISTYSFVFVVLLCVLHFANGDPEGFDPLNLHEDEETVADVRPTVGPDGVLVIPADEEKHGHKGITLFKWEWDHVSVPLTIAFWFFTVTISKIVFHRFEKVHNLLPDSALLIVLGLFFGYVLHVIYPEEIYLRPEWFFLYLLPPIALDAGYFLPNKDFFRNFGTIMTYAVVGTLYNVFSIGFTLYILSGWFKMQPTLVEILLFSTLISAVDPVAVLCVFEEIHVNQLLYICVFGESLLNDAVTIVLYNTFSGMADAQGLTTTDYAKAGASFFIVSFGGLLIGIIWAILTGFTTKHSAHINVVQPLICLLFPYLAYLSAELVAMSGILAIVMCGLMMKQFVRGNLSKKSLVTVQYFMKTLSSSCEALIFVYLGISAVSKNHDIDFLFISITIVSCLVQRFIGVLLLTWLLNLRRVEKIDFVDQFIMGYGGIRGAVCYGLVMSINAEVVQEKNMFATCTIVVILFTVFIQGASIKKLVELLKVKRKEVHKRTVFEMVNENMMDIMMTGIEGITGYHGHYWFRQLVSHWNDIYIKPHLVRDAKTRGTRIVDYHEHIQVKEAEKYLKAYGSFVGLPTIQSKASLTQAPEVVAGLADSSTYTTNGKVDEDEKRFLSPPRRSSAIPRNVSISRFVQDKFDSIRSPFANDIYSRHLLGIDKLPRGMLADYEDDDGEDQFAAMERDSYHMTYPYCKRPARDGSLSERSAVRVKNLFPRDNRTSLKKTSATEARQEHPNVRPRFLITSDPEDFDTTPPNAPRYSKSKSVERDLEQGLALKKLSAGSRGDDSQRKAVPRKGSSINDGERCSLLPVIEVDEVASPTKSESESQS